jgi:allantoinase
MPLLARRGVPLLAHAELTDAPAPPPKGRSYAAYLASRPVTWEEAAIALLLEQARATGCRTHIVHLADAQAVELLRAARAAACRSRWRPAALFYFAAEDIAAGDTASKCALPIREAAHRDGLWQLRDGVIDLIATDHSPCPPALKHLDDGDFESWGGIACCSLGAVGLRASRAPRRRYRAG